MDSLGFSVSVCVHAVSSFVTVVPVVIVSPSDVSVIGEAGCPF